MEINERIVADSIFIKKLNLSELRLIKDGELDWFVLIPLRENMKDWSDLEMEDQFELTREITLLSNKLKKLNPDKINVASLGNVVPQLHIHVLARYQNDRAWPGPIWGTQASKSFDDSRARFWIEEFNES
ncbi:HIT domain-containing protein [Bacteriovorax sp. DB6_IX]|uniref:HIT domain-containing protein n=1 Tax=Bacteriovorax sp. DB6_IX TaxID=1353530 RepID=UPI00038A5096|nr:HIT family protein [Bacteriovorax sp. DB6_IX]EQC51932.1 histidine triad domain protein [Bacteriovorax sp. DB6_IX]